jgi:thioredoxin-related protein
VEIVMMEAGKTINRITLLLASGLLCFVVMTSNVLASGNDGVVVGDDGLYKQAWFIDSFLDLKEDHAEAAADGKGLIILFEQRGCPYCKELHKVNFAKNEIQDYINKNFNVLQLDMWGSRAVTDFDGKEYEERDLAREWRVTFTPTVVFYSKDKSPIEDGESARLPGYFKPFHFLSMLEYVHEGKFEDQHFQRFLQDKFKKMEAEGKKPEVW